MKASFHQGDLVGLVIKGQPLIGQLITLNVNRAVVRILSNNREQHISIRELTVLESNSRRIKLGISIPTSKQINSVRLSIRELIIGWRVLEEEQQNNNNLPIAYSLSDLADLLLNAKEFKYVAALWIWLNSDQPFFSITT